VVHQQDNNGCLTREKKETEEVIQDQFELEYEELWPQDWHLMEMGQETVLHKRANEKRAWLHDIRIAREVGANELDTTTTQLRDAMARWLNRGH